MRSIIRLLVCNVLLACSLTACSGPAARVRAQPAAFARISPADQPLVRHGRIRAGMSQEAVSIAWGKPDAKISGDGGKSGTETWIYRQRVTILEPINSYDGFGPYHGLGDGWPGRGFLPAYAYGGVGFEGTLRYQPHARSLDAVRLAEFSGGKVDRFKNANDAWSAPRPSSKRIVHQGVSRSRVHLAIHKGSHPNGKSRLAHAAKHGHGRHRLTAHTHPHPHGKTGFRTGGSS